MERVSYGEKRIDGAESVVSDAVSLAGFSAAVTSDTAQLSNYAAGVVMDTALVISDATERTTFRVYVNGGHV